MARKKHKPFDPAEAAKHAAERAENAKSIADIRAQPSTAVNIDQRTGRLTGAWRLNCFNTLLPASCPERSAIDWFDDLIRTANGENTGDRRPDHIRASVEGAPGQNISQAMIDAGLQLHLVIEALPATYARMLLELMKPDRDLITRWRPVVQTHTGEDNPQAQGAAVRAACTMLVKARETLPRAEREWRERRRLAA